VGFKKVWGELKYMKIRDSGMPEKNTWENFFNPEEILSIMNLDKNVTDVVGFGCGYGSFTIPVQFQRPRS